MQPYQQQMWDQLEAYTSNDTRMTIFAGRNVGKSLYHRILEQPFFEVLDDHWQYPNHKRVDVTAPVAQWIEQQADHQWENTGVNTWGGFTRYVITPELLTYIKLKWS